MQCGVDSGGTFTDAVADDGRVVKVSSTPADPARSVAEATQRLRQTQSVEVLAHGTTVATNALLERRGAKVALVATRGFSDVIEIARQVRPSLYDPFADRTPPLVPRELRFEVSGRLDGRGKELEPFDGRVPELPDGVDAVAVCLLHADLDPRHERAVRDALRAAGQENIVCSHDVSPEYREYERMATTVTDAYLQPVCTPYLRRLQPLAREVLVMTSAGGLVRAEEAAARPASLLLSGPAGGVWAAAVIAAACGYPDVVTLDMGGTSTDVCLVSGGVPEPSPQRVVAGLPLRLPSLDIHTIGAGGGSIGRIDPGGALVVGPHSAGAWPGPAAYRRGGDEPTVTDADLVLGRIPADAPFPDLGRLDAAAARRALAQARVDAEGMVRVVDASMERAVRVVTVQRGVDPRELALVAFGGAGPLHACAVADALGMKTVIVPPRAGVCSAVGLVCSPRRRDIVRSFAGGDLTAALEEIQQEARTLVSATATVETAVDCRYVGQSHELTVPEPDDFPAAHARRNGHARPGAPVEVVAVRAHATAPAPMAVTDLPDVVRHRVVGPAVVTEPDCTMWVPDGWRAEPRELGAWVLTRT